MQAHSETESVVEVTEDNLDDFLAQEGILPSHSHTRAESPAQTQRAQAMPSYAADSQFSATEELSSFVSASEAQEQLPAMAQCAALNKLLLRQGFSPFVFRREDVDASTLTIGADLVDAWAKSLIPAFEELVARSRQHNEAITDMSLQMSGRETEKASTEALQSRLRRLQEDVDKAERAKEAEQNRCRELQEELTMAKRSSKTKLDEARRRLTTLEMQLAESNRAITERDKQLDSLRTKLEKVLKNQRETAASISSPHRSFDQRSSGSGSPGNRVHTTEATRREMLEMRQQLRELTDTLEERENTIARIVGRARATSSTTLGSHPGSTTSDLPETLRELSQKARQDEQRAAQATHQRDALAVRVQQLETDVEEKNQQLQRLEDERENLLLELQSRPTAKALRERERRIAELESKLHDALTGQQRQAEVNGWKKHLSTSERIARDRLNHELGLNKLEDLPTEMMKEVLRDLCRELQLSDISELAPAVRKLKAVVRTVPRMERFINDVCSFTFAQETRAGHHRPTMEEAMPVIKSWHSQAGMAEQLLEHLHQLQAALSRRDRRLARDPSWGFSSRALNSPVALERAVEQMVRTIEELTELEYETLQGDAAFELGDEYVKQNPELLVSRLINHIQNLFQIKSLEGMLPHMNRVYIFTEQMRNFLTGARADFGYPSEMSDEALLKELDQVLKKRVHGGYGNGHSNGRSADIDSDLGTHDS